MDLASAHCFAIAPVHVASLSWIVCVCVDSVCVCVLSVFRKETSACNLPKANYLRTKKYLLHTEPPMVS